MTGPLGDLVEASWVLQGSLAVIEMAQASGLLLAGGEQGNDPLEATTVGTGELIALAMKSGATEIVVGAGGSATTDGGLGALRALWPHSRLREVDVVVATDVDTRFLDAPKVFGPQKGASPAQVALLEARMRRLADEYERDFGVDVSVIPGSGAAGGLAGGLAAVGATIVPGFDYLADIVGLDARMEQADLVVTGEGSLDEQSAHGKVVGGVIEMARRFDVPVLVVAGVVDVTDVPPGFLDGVTVVSLTERFGAERSQSEVLACIEAAVTDFLRRWTGR